MNFLEAYSWINIRFLLSGLWLTIQVAGITIILSVIIGILLGIVRYYEIPYLYNQEPTSFINYLFYLFITTTNWYSV